jgi:hypothetical protein
VASGNGWPAIVGCPESTGRGLHHTVAPRASMVRWPASTVRTKPNERALAVHTRIPVVFNKELIVATYVAGIKAHVLASHRWVCPWPECREQCSEVTHRTCLLQHLLAFNALQRATLQCPPHEECLAEHAEGYTSGSMEPVPARGYRHGPAVLPLDTPLFVAGVPAASLSTTQLATYAHSVYPLYTTLVRRSLAREVNRVLLCSSATTGPNAPLAGTAVQTAFLAAAWREKLAHAERGTEAGRAVCLLAARATTTLDTRSDGLFANTHSLGETPHASVWSPPILPGANAWPSGGLRPVCSAPAEQTQSSPVWRNVGCTTPPSTPPLAGSTLSALEADGRRAVATLSGMTRTRPPPSRAPITVPLAEVVAGTAVVSRAGAAPHGIQQHPVCWPSNYRRRGVPAYYGTFPNVFLSTDRAFVLENARCRVLGEPRPVQAKEIRQRVTLLDAYQDMHDIATWTDGATVAVHNTLHAAARGCAGSLAPSLAASMPLPVLMAWPSNDSDRPDRARPL